LIADCRLPIADWTLAQTPLSHGRAHGIASKANTIIAAIFLTLGSGNRQSPITNRQSP
jgi:hypothetical protein